MILGGDLRKGSKIIHKGQPYIVVDFQLVKPGKGGTYMRTKMKNLISGLMHEETFRADERLETPNLETKTVMFAYKDDNIYHFIDQDNFEDISLDEDQITEVKDYLKDQTNYNVLYFNDRAITVTPPLFMELKVIETVPGVKGDTAQGGATKPATLESGLVIQVPLFVDEGNVIKIDTRTGGYVERIDKKK